jgi:cysteinyl-tRNA synthetase
MPLRIYNVLGRELQEFKPITEGKVGMYVCGPTVYDAPHIGHAKNYVSFDIVVRYLRHIGYSVLYVQNITDVGHLRDSGEDPIQIVARRTQSGPMQVAEFYTRKFFEAMDALYVTRPDISPRAAGHIPEQIKMIETLIEKGYAYQVGGNVYFDITKDADYGKLSNRTSAEQEATGRVAEREDKRNPEDFALWKIAAPDHILRWDSPWGVGFPGWHIECSAMAKKYLGTTFDIHGGGIDNQFPHNESEIAQSESCNDAPYANYWMLVGSLTVDGVKMGKSLGNFTTIEDALKKHSAAAIRYFTLQGHYTQPMNFTDDALVSAGKGWEGMYNAVRLNRRMIQSAPQGSDGNAMLSVIEQTKADFYAAMDNDFNTPIALSTLQGLTREVNTLLNSGSTVGLDVLSAIDDAYKALGGDVLGIIPEKDVVATGGNSQRESALIQMLIDMRLQARKAKNFAESDRIRDQLANIGVMLEDRPNETIWRVE